MIGNWIFSRNWDESRSKNRVLVDTQKLDFWISLNPEKKTISFGIEYRETELFSFGFSPVLTR